MTRPFRRAGSALAAILLTSSACGGAVASPAPSDATAPPSPVVSPSAVVSAPPSVQPSQPTAKPQQASVGKVNDVILEQGFVDDEDAAPGNPVFRGSSVRTSDSGALEFDVKNRIKSCTMVQSSEVRVQPSADVLVDFVAGTTTCTTAKTSKDLTLTANGTTTIRTPDPVLVVSIDGDNVTVGIASGIAQIRNTSIADNTPMYVGPKSVTFVPKEGPPGEPSGMDIGSYPDIVGEAINGQLAGIKPPPSGLPDSKGSPVLRRIDARKLIQVGVDEQLAENQQVRNFIDLLMERQGQQWDVKTDNTSLAAGEVPASFKEGAIDLFFTTGRVANSSGPLPIVHDPNQDQQVVVYIPKDNVFLQRERAFLQDLVNRGGYREVYLRSFDQEPDYGSIAGLFGLG